MQKSKRRGGDFWVIMVCTLLMMGACGEPNSSQPVISLEAYEISPGYELSVVASEPLIQAPVAIDFDHLGRIWVAEMPGYMMNLDALGEHTPDGRIVILSDHDQDGRMDHASVFLDSLVLPRALRLYAGGLLYAEPPNLWWVEVTEDDLPGKRVLVDSTYVTAGNVEHQPNGLLPNLDNWLYSAKSNLRYRIQAGEWERDFTAYRGQWGLTHDDYGRLYYNHNSTLLLADQAYPQAVLQHPYYRPQHSLHQTIVDNQRLYPQHPTLMNRGYQPGVLDSTGKLKYPSAACGPLVYRGGELAAEETPQAFVCLPEANLIKRIFLGEEQGVLQGLNPKAPDFLTSTDPYFRPVNLNDGPDGELYIVDMHRGVIQHQAYMTGYLRELLTESQMDTAIYGGRILAVRKKGQSASRSFDWQAATVAELVATLSSPNGWRRDRAQQELIHRQAYEAIPALKLLLAETSPLPALHAFWTLEGLKHMDAEAIQMALDHPDDKVHVTGLYATMLLDLSSDQLTQLRWEHLWDRQAPELDHYLALALPRLLKEPGDLMPRLAALGERNPTDALLADFMISGWGRYDSTQPFPSSPTPILTVANTLGESLAKKKRMGYLHSVAGRPDKRTRGLTLYRTHCSGCHGIAGRGQAELAPPLVNSAYVDGPIEQLALVLLYGLKGPIQLQEGEEPMIFAAQMPGFGQNQQLRSQDLTAIIAYVRNAFSPESPFMAVETLDSLRQIGRPHSQAFTEAELKEFLN